MPRKVKCCASPARGYNDSHLKYWSKPVFYVPSFLLLVHENLSFEANFRGLNCMGSCGVR